ncbi:MAG: prepilin-type N-terminal cleavage/methylation domain-containing protein [Phycisphaeraceae bacterium]
MNIQCRTRHARQTHLAFTLIELLVVISIIALLIALLLPALGSARESGRSVKCLSMLKQVNLANQLYAEEMRGFFVPVRIDTTCNNNAGNVNWYANRRFQELMGVHNIGTQGISWDKARNWLCPTSATANSAQGNMGLNYGCNYTYNSTGTFSNIPGSSGLEDPRNPYNTGVNREKQVRSPSSNAMVLDGLNDRLSMSGSGAYTGETTGIINRAAYRHHGQGTINIAYFDGHGANQPRAKVDALLGDLDTVSALWIFLNLN